MVIAGDSSWGGIIDDVELVSLDPDVPGWQFNGKTLA